MKEDNRMGFSVQEIKELMEAISRNNIGSFEIEKEDYAIRIEGAAQMPGNMAQQPSAVYSYATPAPAVAVPEMEEKPVHKGNVVKSPIVGTFYAAPSPDKDPYVKVGSKVKKGDVLFIIESMKLMNEVTSEYSGTVTDIVVDNAEAVEYGQPILYIE